MSLKISQPVLYIARKPAQDARHCIMGMTGWLAENTFLVSIMHANRWVGVSGC